MNLSAQPHHDGSPCYTGGEPRAPQRGLGRPEPGLGTLPASGESVAVRVWVPHLTDGAPAAEHIVLRAVRDGEPHVSPAVEVGRDQAGSWWEADLRLVNPVTSYRFLVAGRDGSYGWLTAAGVFARDVTDAGDFKLGTHHRLPAWVPDQIGYQIFPDRFGRTETGRAWPDWARPAAWDDTPPLHQGSDVPHQLYGGTLDGIVEHLDHVESLNANLIYLTPFFEARSNHRYDAVSFDRVDPVLGGDQAFDRLVAAAHGRGIRVVGDLTTNHSGVEHEWFQRAAADATSVERGFYRFGEDGSYAAWWDIPTLPKFDHASQALAERLYQGRDSVVATWLRRGLDGWRIDVANMTGRLGSDDYARDVARAIRATMAAERGDAWLLAEHGHDASLDLLGDGWQGTMDYAGFTRPVWCWLNGGSPSGPGIRHGLSYLGLPVDIPVLPGAAAAATMREVHAAMPWAAYTGSTMHLDSHDTPRFRTVTGGGTHGGVDQAGMGRDRHLLGVALQLTMPGMPVVYAGDEIGLTGVDGEHARTPFPWSRPGSWDSPTLQAYRSWTRLRRDHVALRRGGLRWLHVGADSMTYLRQHPEETVLVHVARARHDAVSLPALALGAHVAELEPLAGEPAAVAGGRLILPADGPAASAYLVMS